MSNSQFTATFRETKHGKIVNKIQLITAFRYWKAGKRFANEQAHGYLNTNESEHIKCRPAVKFINLAIFLFFH
jgi:hypothetical protein